jgi:hypothetical protein
MPRLRLTFAFACLAFGFSMNARAQNLTTVSASNIQDINGVKLAAGQLCFLITDQNDNPISAQIGGGGQTLKRGYCAPVAAGGVTGFTVPNPANTQPSGIYYRVTVKDSSTGQEVLRYAQVAFAGGVFNFDIYAPTFPTFVAPTTNATVGNLTINGNLAVTGSMSFTPSSFLASNATINQAANGNDAIFGKRATDTSPTGNFEHFRNFANSADLWTVDVTGTLQAGTVPTSRLSGTITPAQLPNPSASTLGGVQSFASVAHQWLNSISTSGVPAASQPAASDLSNGTTGSGTVVLSTSPSLTTPNIGAATGSTQTFVNQAAPANPSAGNIVIYSDSGTGNLTCRNSAGGSCLPSVAPFISGSANPATTGTLRAASGDTAIAFRNNANSADVVGLSKNASDVVSVGGAAGITTLGPVTLGATDAGLSRTAAASVAVGNGAAGDSSGTLLATTVTLPSTGLIKIGSNVGISTFGAPNIAFGNGTQGSASAILQAGSAQLSVKETLGASADAGIDHVQITITYTVPAPAQPTNLTVTAAANGLSNNLSWTNNATTQTSYQINKCTGASCSPSTYQTGLSAAATSFTDSSGVIPGTTYGYQACAVNSGGTTCSTTTFVIDPSRMKKRTVWSWITRRNEWLLRQPSACLLHC